MSNRSVNAGSISSHSKTHIEERDHHDIHRHSDEVAALNREHEHFTRYPNRWSKIRYTLREPLAEFFGTMILILFGTGVDCQVVLSSVTRVTSSPKGEYLSINLGWAIGTALGVWVSGGISGGHINPAVTLSLAVFRGFPWKKVPIFMFAQFMGALIGALIVYANYFHAINLFEGGRSVRTLDTAGLFTTFAQPYLTSVSCFFDEFIGTAILLICVLAITDRQNGPPPSGLVPLALFFLVLGIGACFGVQTGYAINPARDFGPRIALAMVGYGRQIFSYRSQYWLWCPIIGPFVGALAGSFVYDAFIFTGGESILNKPDAAARRRHEHARNTQNDKIPAGVEATHIV